MGVTFDTSYLKPMHRMLGKSFDAAKDISTHLCTGKRIIRACEDTTGLAIGSKLESTASTIKTVLISLEQTQAIISTAEQNLNKYKEVVGEMRQMATRGQSGLMTDKRLKQTVKPAYMQCKEELNRIVNTTEFDGLKLFDGSGGTVTLGTKASLTDGVLSGGQATTSTFNFVCGQSLQKDIVRLTLPNMTLETRKGTDGKEVNGIISALNVTGYTGKNAPDGLSAFDTVQDAIDDALLLDELEGFIIDTLSNIGAMESRIMNVKDQLSVSVEQLAAATAPIMQANLAELATESAGIAVATTIAISQIAKAGEQLSKLVDLVR